MRPPQFDTPKKPNPNAFKMVYRKREAEIKEDKVDVEAEGVQDKKPEPLPIVIADSEVATLLAGIDSLRVIACPFEFECNAVYGSASAPACFLRLRQGEQSDSAVTALVEKCSRLSCKYARVHLVLEGGSPGEWNPRLKTLKGIRIVETGSGAETAKAIAAECARAAAQQLIPSEEHRSLDAEFLFEVKEALSFLVSEVPQLTFISAAFILRTFGSLQRVTDCTAKEIEKEASVSTAIALAIYDALHCSFD